MIVCLGISYVANIFLVGNIYGFVAFEKGYPMRYTRKSVHSIFEWKIPSEDGGVSQWHTKSSQFVLTQQAR